MNHSESRGLVQLRRGWRLDVLHRMVGYLSDVGAMARVAILRDVRNSTIISEHAREAEREARLVDRFLEEGSQGDA